MFTCWVRPGHTCSCSWYWQGMLPAMTSCLFCFLMYPNRNVPWRAFLFNIASELGHSSPGQRWIPLSELGFGFLIPSAFTEIHRAQNKPDPVHDYSIRTFRRTVFYCSANPAWFYLYLLQDIQQLFLIYRADNRTIREATVWTFLEISQTIAS
jgi:hypothetical protein